MKKILLIGLRYHNYTQAIISELGALGYHVTFHDIQPRTLYYKALPPISSSLFATALSRHHRSIIETERGRHYDIVLFIQAHQFSVENIGALRREHSDSRFILYNWDSLTTHDYRPQMSVFDRVFTFDPDDARALAVNYLPLFCIRDFQNLQKKRQERNAVYFVGNVVSAARYEALQLFNSYCRSEGIEFAHHMACTPRVALRLLARGIVPADVSFGAIDQAAFIEMVESSTTVFDFANHRQSGYTMRTIENLCADKKLVTNNPNIRHETFFTPDRIHVFDNLDFSGVKEFMAEPMSSPSDVFNQFYIQNFVHSLLE